VSALSPVIEGDFAISDLLREAAERSIEITYLTDSIDDIAMPSMSGRIIAEEVQPGLLMSGFDLTYTADLKLDAALDRSVSCSILLEGDGEALEIGGLPPIPPERERVQILGLGEAQVCARPWYAGQKARVFGMTIKPCFFERFGSLVEEDGLAALHRFLSPGIHCATLPWSGAIVDLANSALNEPYGGTLRVLFREAQALRFTLEVASLLQEEDRLVREIGRRHYDRVCHARDILDRALADPPKVLDLARQLGVHVSTLQAHFKATLGTTIFGYVRARRLDMARILIRDHGLGIAEASYKVGFTNAAAFSVAYRRQFGRSPSAERFGPGGRARAGGRVGGHDPVQ
jgi:AraC-like DNA-binding protein